MSLFIKINNDNLFSCERFFVSSQNFITKHAKFIKIQCFLFKLSISMHYDNSVALSFFFHKCYFIFTKFSLTSLNTRVMLAGIAFLHCFP